MSITLQQLDRIEARIEMGLIVICVGVAAILLAAAVSILKNLKHWNRE